MPIALACLLLLAPQQTFELKYRFTKGMSYLDTQHRVWKLTMWAKGKKLEYHDTHAITVRRTILETDESQHPVAERVEVTLFRLETLKSPEQKQLGLKPEACEGKTFTWKRLKTRWGLFDAKGDVSGRHQKLVTYLKNWRDARLPKEPQPVGGAWAVTAKKFLLTAGLRVPPNLEGLAEFKLEQAERGIATIPFHVRYTFRAGAAAWTVVQKGTWMFDAKRGRDISFSMQGEVVLKGSEGKGTLNLQRRVTYSPR